MNNSAAAGLAAQLAADYSALTSGVAQVDLACRDRIELTGNDRAAFLHNLCSNEIRKLQPGSGCEAFLLNVQGKILGHLVVLCRPESLVLETVGGSAPGLLEHLERYHIREAVELHDRTSAWGELLVAGPLAKSTLESLGARALPSEHLAGVETALAGQACLLWRITVAPVEGYLVFAQAAELETVQGALDRAGAPRAGTAALDVARIEAGWPIYGRDISDKNLPQEVNRDARAIHFTKGCYLGQETVARIDALGHVNKLLVPVKFAHAAEPQPGDPLRVGEQVVGEVTSACWSPRQGAPLALAYLRRGQTAVGTQVAAPTGPGEVIALA